MKHFSWAIIVVALCATTLYILDTFRGQADLAEAKVRYTSIERLAEPEMDWHAVRQAVAGVVQTSRAQALEEANQQLAAWQADVMHRLDADFLEWYFGYWNTQKRSASYLWTWLWDDEQTANTEMAETIANELSARALPPHLVDKELESIAMHTADTFVKRLRRGLQEVPRRYSIPPTRWESYLDGITFTIADRDASDQRLTDASLKSVYVLGTLGGVSIATAAAPLIKSAMTRMGSAMGSRAASYGARIAGKAIARTTVRQSVSTVGAKTGSVVSGPLIAAVAIVGIGIWEWWDHTTMVEEERPRMRANIAGFLKQFKQDLLRADGAIGAPVHQIETAIYESVTKA